MLNQRFKQKPPGSVGGFLWGDKGKPAAFGAPFLLASVSMSFLFAIERDDES